ncbi:MAG: hypothetical protein IJR63_00210 [Synergistaceae bacterium]|nr:hypothetical protein [Synergistaceae bacterium]
MNSFRIVDMAGNCEKSFPPDSFRGTELILIMGITESNIDSAIEISESARAEGIVTAGIISVSMNPNSENMTRLHGQKMKMLHSEFQTSSQNRAS